MKKYYFDTSIWLDYYLKRGVNGESALKLIYKIISEDNLIIYSDILITELKRLGFFENEINDMLNVAKPTNLRLIQSTKVQSIETNKLVKQRRVPFGDILHAVVARDNEAIFVSRDKHFEKLKDIIKVNIPEELI